MIKKNFVLNDKILQDQEQQTKADLAVCCVFFVNHTYLQTEIARLAINHFYHSETCTYMLVVYMT